MRRGSAIRGLLVGGVLMTSACGTNDSDTVGPGDEPADPVAEAELASRKKAAAKVTQTLGPKVPSKTEQAKCGDLAVKDCSQYRIELLGDVANNSALRQAYKDKFGAACYMSATNAFNCYFKTPGKACEQVMFVPGIFGAAAYEKHPETCKHQAGNIWTLQTGPDPANVTYIYYEKPPLQHPLIWVNGTPSLEVNGPYRNLPEPLKVLPGRDFHCSSIGGVEQTKRILEMNRKGNGGKIRSDLAGYMWSCTDEDGNATMCTEKTELKDPATTPNVAEEERAEVDHVASLKDPRGCDWGTNSNKNAAVISRKLNNHLSNKEREKKVFDMINAVPPYAL
jgi:hypothetical protein